MEFKNKTGYNLVPSEEHYNTHMKEPLKEYPPIYNDEDVEKENENKNKKKKETKGNEKKLRQRKTFWVCFSNVQIGSRVLSDDESEKEKKKELEDDPLKVAVKDGFLFSNAKIEPEEESEKVQELVEKMNKKSCILICFSNFQVAH